MPVYPKTPVVQCQVSEGKHLEQIAIGVIGESDGVGPQKSRPMCAIKLNCLQLIFVIIVVERKLNFLSIAVRGGSKNLIVVVSEFRCLMHQSRNGLDLLF